MKKFAEQLTVVYIVTWYLFGVAYMTTCEHWYMVGIGIVFPPYPMVMLARLILTKMI